MVSSIGQNNSVQLFSAVNALRNAAAPLKKQDENDVLQEENLSLKSAPKSILDRIDTNELRECAKTVGEYNITDEDIKYGLIYGRSVIAEYLA